MHRMVSMMQFGNSASGPTEFGCDGLSEGIVLTNWVPIGNRDFL